MSARFKAYRARIAPYMSLGGVRYRILVEMPGHAEVRVLNAIGFGTARRAREWADARIQIVSVRRAA